MIADIHMIYVRILIAHAFQLGFESRCCSFRTVSELVECVVRVVS